MSAQDTEADESNDEPNEEQSPGTFSGRLGSDAAETLFGAVGASADEARFDFDAEGVVAHNVDPAGVLMSMVEAPAGAWEAYESTGLSLGFDLRRIGDLVTTGDVASLEWDTTEFRMLVESGPADARLSALDADTVRTERPSEKVWDGMQTEWTMPYSDLDTALRSAEHLSGDVVEIVYDDGWVGFRKAGDIDKLEVEFDHADVIDSPDGSVRSLMSAEYMKEVRSAMPTGSELVCELAAEWPFSMRYEHEGLVVRHVQAPRIENN